MRIVVDDNEKNEEWDEFVHSVPGGHHDQTYEWGLLKKSMGWGVNRVIILDQHKITAGAQILTRNVPLIGRVSYITKGPLAASRSPEMICSLIQRIFQLAKEQNCTYIAVQPPNNGDFMVEPLIQEGFRESSIELVPSASLILDLTKTEEQIFSEMSKQTRRHITHCQKSGLDVRIRSERDLDSFYKLYLSTAHRQKFSPYPSSYFYKLWDLFYPKGWIGLVMVFLDNEPISGQLLVSYKDTVIAKKVGWSGCHSQRRPNDAMYWASIRWAKEQGYQYFDLEGLDPAGARILDAGGVINDDGKMAKDKFKYGYGGQIVFYPVAYDLVLNPLENWAYRRTQRLIQKVPVFNQIVDLVRNR